MAMKRRDLLKLAASLPFANIAFNERALAEEDAPMPSKNRFLLYIHMGSVCGMSSGLVQPLSPGNWPKGYFYDGKDGSSVNPLLNKHSAADNGMVFNDYLKFLAPISKQMCLVNGTPQSLDHNVARLYQQRGVSNSVTAPEWAMAVTEFMKTEERKNPIIISGGVKTLSVPDVTTVQAKSLDEFARITQDIDLIPKTGNDAFIELLKNRFNKPKLGSVISESNLKSLADYQLATLTEGLKELSQAENDKKSLIEALKDDNVANLVKDCVEADKIKDEAKSGTLREFRDQLILAGILAKTGLANGMSITGLFGFDTHNVPSDVESPRNAAAIWSQIHLFWTWIQANNMQDDFLIVVSHDFSRSQYNGKYYKAKVKNTEGKEIEIDASGRDHDLSMGMMFINSGVPKGGRVGYIAENRVAQASKDAKGTADTSGKAYTAENIVGSMLLRLYPELFPTERMVRKHWPTFIEIPPILS